VEIGLWTMVWTDLNGFVPERRVNDEEVCQTEAEVSGPLETGYHVQFLNGLEMTTSKSKER
jgi:hypothetical protein